MSVTAGVSDAVITVRDKLRGKIGQTKVKRYFPGKAPEWADDVDQDGDIRSSSAALESAFPTRHHSEPSSARTDDPRLRRLAQSSAASRDEARADHRRIRQAEIVSTRTEEEERGEDESAAGGLEEEEADADEAALEERRRRIKERSRMRELEQASLLPPVQEEDEEEDEEGEESGSSEYETGSDSEGEGVMAMVKPVFVAKAARETLAERERAEAREAEAEEAERQKLEERKKETKQIVVEVIRRDEESRKTAAAEEAADVDTDDEANEAEEYEAWKAREMGRIKRDRDGREAQIKEREEVERLRKMTEEERREWERRNPKQGASGGRQQKEKWKFMQKYFHKGAFFQDKPDDVAATVGADEIYSRDFSAPTGDDKMDKTNLPKIMQVKHFGRSGRTKWTHLVNEDTTDWNNPWMSNDALRAKYNDKMAGNNTPLEKPKGSKKLKDWERR